MNHEKIGTRNIFRMAEKSTKIFVSDSLANILTANNITGMRITKSPNLDRLYDSE